MSKNIEIEIRADLTEKEFSLISSKFSDSFSYSQTNYYLDNSQLSFSNENHGLRIRKKNNKFELTAKIKDGENYLEINQEITAKTKEILVKPGNFPKGEIYKYLQKNNLINPDNLFIVCELKTTRLDINYKDTVISLDKNEYCGIVDYNIECESINNPNVENTLKEFLNQFNIELRKSKFTKLQKAISKIK